MKYYIRPTGRTGRLAARLNRPFTTAQAAKAMLKEWLSEANGKRKAAGKDTLRVGDFKIISVEAHPYARAKS